ncbi:MAG: hypothetical protein HY748_11725 [Elusimicrobia bacterium]|nr:hypothetical protein [Elusimicrobiota bacterium]
MALPLGCVLCVLLNGVFSLRRPPVPADPVGLQLEESGALETAFLFGMGMRRLASDLGLIRMLLYYGGAEEEMPGEAPVEPAGSQAHGHGHGHEHRHGRSSHYDPGHPERPFGGGRYPRLGPMAMRILDLDPSYSYPALFAAGALAFNLNRPQEALWVLDYAMKRDPGNLRYHQYVAAVGAHRKGTPKGVIGILETVVLDPECPTMIKNMLGFLYFKNGQKAKAIRVYRQILEESRDPSYRGLAERMLRRLDA